MIDLSGVGSLLITGTNGFVGRSIIDQIAKLETQQLPHEILLVTRQGIDFDVPTSLNSRIKLFNQDLTQNWKFDNEVTHVINLAADGSQSPYSEAANNTFTSIVANLVAWISTCQEFPRVFHASTGACSGYKPINQAIKAANPKSSFALNRLEAETTLKNASKIIGFELSIGRLFTFSGIHLLRKGQYAVSDFIKSAISTNSIKVTGDPNTVRSYLHQDAMAEWILQALVWHEPDTSLEIGSSHKVTIRELAEFIAQETSASVSFPEAPDGGDVYLPNNQETRDKLGVTEGKSWDLAIKEMINVERKKFHGIF